MGGGRHRLRFEYNPGEAGCDAIAQWSVFTFQAMERVEIGINAVVLIHQPIAQAKPAYVLVNNRSEDNAPKTIQSLVDQLQATKHAGSGDDHMSQYIK